jgi:hypothetical protein
MIYGYVRVSTAIGLGLVSGVARAKAEGKKLGRPRKVRD